MEQILSPMWQPLSGIFSSPVQLWTAADQGREAVTVWMILWWTRKCTYFPFFFLISELNNGHVIVCPGPLSLCSLILRLTDSHKVIWKENQERQYWYKMEPGGHWGSVMYVLVFSLKESDFWTTQYPNKGIQNIFQKLKMFIKLLPWTHQRQHALRINVSSLMSEYSLVAFAFISPWLFLFFKILFKLHPNLCP